MKLNAIIQSRMTSNRYPGKVLAPLLGRPLLDRIVEQVKKAEVCSSIILATTTDKADDPLANYGKELGLEVVRGSRDDVVDRYILALKYDNCDGFFRICGDSPLLLAYLMNHAAAIYKIKKYDLITNIFPRSYPQGMSIELIKTNTFLKIHEKIITKDEREHITKHFYINFKNYEIKNIECATTENLNLKFAVDELSDLKKIEMWMLDNKKIDFESLFPIKFDE